MMRAKILIVLFTGLSMNLLPANSVFSQYMCPKDFASIDIETKPLQSTLANPSEIRKRLATIAEGISSNKNGYRDALKVAFNQTIGRTPVSAEIDAALYSLRNASIEYSDSEVEGTYGMTVWHSSPPQMIIYQDRWNPNDRKDQLNTAIHEFIHALSMTMIGPTGEILSEEEDQEIMRRFANTVNSSGYCGYF